jgi:hypothetical protein
MTKLVNTISRIEATKRVQNWLKYAIEKLGFKPADVPKAIFIPRADLDDAIHEFEKFDKQQRKSSGIRIYFTKNLPTNQINDDLRLTCIVVPTVMSNSKDRNTGLPIHNDAIIKIPTLRKSVGADIARSPNGGGGGGGGDSESIYDFTSPCPTDCGGTTEWG